MVSDKKTKTDAAPKAAAAAKKEAPAATKNEGQPKEQVKEQPKEQSKDKAASGESPAKADGGDATAAPKAYSRGEGQKPVTQAYKDNWNAIYGKKKKR